MEPTIDSNKPEDTDDLASISMDVLQNPLTYSMESRRSTRIAKKMPVSGKSGIYSKPRIHFTGKGIVKVASEDDDKKKPVEKIEFSEFRDTDEPFEDDLSLSDKEYNDGAIVVDDMIYKSKKLGDAIECNICFKYIKQSCIGQHMKTHLGNRNHMCTVCNAAFTRKGDVTRHVNMVHKVSTSHEVMPSCDICNSAFTTHTKLVNHITTHHASTENSYQCKTCKYKFMRKEYYDSHIRYIHPQGKGKLPSSNSVSNKDEVKKLYISASENGSPMAHSKINSSKDESDSPNKTYEEIKSATKRLKSSYKKENDESEIETDAELVNQAIHSAVSKAEETLENIINTVGNNFTNSTSRSLSSQEDSDINDDESRTPRTTEIQVNACVSGIVRKFKIEVPQGSIINVSTQEGMSMIVNMVNHLCEGKGSIDGPVEVILSHKR